MEASTLSSLSTSLANQRTAAEFSSSIARIAKNDMKQKGEAAMELIASVPQPQPPKPQGSLGHHIDVRA